MKRYELKKWNSLDTSHINTSQAVVKSIVLHWGFEYSFTFEKTEFKIDRHLLGNVNNLSQVFMEEGLVEIKR